MAPSLIEASIESTRLVNGQYANDWDKFLTQWQAEMQRLDKVLHGITTHNLNLSTSLRGDEM
ncbi:hypothetical protein KUIN1_26380 [Pseudomonas sp. KUIN-1]|nr:hypothetical protein KUIN1_26380 [Pseudomonas sp. KUIN-1]